MLYWKLATGPRPTEQLVLLYNDVCSCAMMVGDINPLVWEINAQTRPTPGSYFIVLPDSQCQWAESYKVYIEENTINHKIESKKLSGFQFKI